MRIYLATPRLRGLLALNLSVAAAGAMVIVNTVVLVRHVLCGTSTDVAVALACFGGGSMVAAVVLPGTLDRFRDRMVMLDAGAFLAVVLVGFAVVLWGASPAARWPALLLAWTLLGIGYSSILTPSGRLLRRSAHAADRPALFAAQFALSHACWLVTYPIAGWLGATFGISTTLVALGAITVLGTLLAASVWPAHDTDVVEHEHPDLDFAHEHLREHPGHGRRHAHALVIDDLHQRWPAARA